MIRIYIPGFSTSDSGGPRWGDAQIIDDGINYEVIDGYCGVGTTRLIKRMKKRKILQPYLYISHAHYDHYKGIREIINYKEKGKYVFQPKALYCYDPESLRTDKVENSRGYGYIKAEISTMNKIIKEAEDRGIPVKFLKHGDHIKHGDIDFYVYRKQPRTLYKDDSQGDAYMNDGSLCFWFPTLKYWTSGDGPERIYDMCKSVGAKPVMFKIPHHGNNCTKSQAEGLKESGAIYCWDNDISNYYTDFLMYGRRRCEQAGIKYFSCRGDLNMIAFGGKVCIYKDDGVYRYTCSYKGKTALKGVNSTVVRQVMRGTYGTANARMTNLIDAGYYPVAVQNKVNAVVRIAKGIKAGTMNYGRNQNRINRIDKELGKGYGQLVQDYINVLYGIRKGV